MRLLLVEDNERLAETTKQGLEKEAFTVDWFGTESESNAALEAVSYDAVILDLGLPDGDGLQVLKKCVTGDHRHL
jgi:DNA-binding response OmpR family regulator